MSLLPRFQKHLQALDSLREKYLASRPVASIARSLGKLSRRWLDPQYPFRRKAAARLVRRSGYSAASAAALLDALFGALGERDILKLLSSEFKDPGALDGFVRDKEAGREVRAIGPGLVTHVFAANVPNPAVVSFVLGLLVKSANVGKVSSRDPGILDIYLESLKEADPGLAAPNWLLSEGGGRSALAEALASSGLVVAYGSDGTIKRIRRKVPAGVPFVGYGHRMSLALYTRGALEGGRLDELCRRTAHDVWMMNQRGCLSPLVVFAEGGAGAAPQRLAEGIAKVLRGKSYAKGGRFFPATAHILGRFERAQAVRRLKEKHARSWSSDTPGHWAVGYEGLHENCRSGLVPWGCPVLSVRAYRRLENVLRSLKPFQPFLQAVAVEATGGERLAIAERLSALGVNRVCRAGAMQKPPLAWHHDGKLNLASWVRWTDLEK